MAERLNCVQNQVTTHNRVLIRNKVAGFIIVGGQDNVQGVAGQMLGFFAELGFHFPQFPYIAHSRGWSAEDMENNVRHVRDSEELHAGAGALALRAVELAERLIATAPARGPAHQRPVISRASAAKAMIATPTIGTANRRSRTVTGDTPVIMLAAAMCASDR